MHSRSKSNKRQSNTVYVFPPVGMKVSNDKKVISEITVYGNCVLITSQHSRSCKI